MHSDMLIEVVILLSMTHSRLYCTTEVNNTNPASPSTTTLSTRSAFAMRSSTYVPHELGHPMCRPTNNKMSNSSAQEVHLTHAHGGVTYHKRINDTETSRSVRVGERTNIQLPLITIIIKTTISIAR